MLDIIQCIANMWYRSRCHVAKKRLPGRLRFFRRTCSFSHYRSTAAFRTNVLMLTHPAYLDLNLPSRQYRSTYPGAERFSDEDIYKFCR
ncbi:hypothetical protein F4604DRAFT_1726217 [Suillus subluteus]|nr:hypothetical protein F4604DRAFT_1726217 [Suillus subluteus]